MKKILLATAIFAAASINSFGAACNTFATLQDLFTATQGGNSCSVDNGTNTWNLTNFNFSSSGQPSTTGYGSPSAVPARTDVGVSFVNAFGAGTNGFEVRFFDAPNGTNFFNAVSQNPNANQTVSWKTNFHILDGPAITGVVNTLAGGFANGSGADKASIVVQKIITNIPNGNSIIGDNTLTLTNDGVVDYTGAVTNMAGNTATYLSVVDNYQLNGGNQLGNTAYLSGYSNTFYTADPQTGVPEPMTFVLMGAGLVGIAALRRRKA